MIYQNKSAHKTKGTAASNLNNSHHQRRQQQLILKGPGKVARARAFEADLAFFLGPDWRVRSSMYVCGTVVGKSGGVVTDIQSPNHLDSRRPSARRCPGPRRCRRMWNGWRRPRRSYWPCTSTTCTWRCSGTYMFVCGTRGVRIASSTQQRKTNHQNRHSGGQILRRLTRAALGLDKQQPPQAATGGGSGTGTAIYEFSAPAAELKERLRAAVDGMEAAGACVYVCLCVLRC